MTAVLNLLARIGLIRFDGAAIVWPFSVQPLRWWRHSFLHGPRIGVFRNRPGVIRDIPGRLLPRRWGVFVLGFEFGDRGAGPRLVLREATQRSETT